MLASLGSEGTWSVLSEVLESQVWKVVARVDSESFLSMRHRQGQAGSEGRKGN